MRLRYKCIIYRLLFLLTAVMLSGCSVWQKHDGVPGQHTPERTELSATSPQRQQPQEAVLADATQLYRICSSRPQRILPTNVSRSERTVTPYGGMVRQHIVKPLHSYFDSRCRLESAPFCLSASCLYYVIALRHIIR